LRGAEVLIPLQKGRTSLAVTEESVEKWCHDGWVDLRPQNVRTWQNRFAAIRASLAHESAQSTGSTNDFDSSYWGGLSNIDEGKLAAFILHNEERGGRIKR
jgi:hypothetical protein